MYILLQVMDERQSQVQEKMDAVHIEQEESVERREELLREMEMANRMTEREHAAQREEITHRKIELQSQVSNNVPYMDLLNERMSAIRQIVKTQHNATVEERHLKHGSYSLMLRTD